MHDHIFSLESPGTDLPESTLMDERGEHRSADLTKPHGNKIPFSRFRNNRGNMAKLVELSPAGDLDKTPAAFVTDGHVETVEATLPELQSILAGLSNNEAIGLGVCDRAPAAVVTSAALPDHPDAVARTLDCFHMLQGLALGFVDSDTDATPDEVLGAISKAFPSFSSAAKLLVPSTSAGIYRTGDERPVSSSHGVHVYFAVKDGPDSERFGAVLCKRLWLAGNGHLDISEDGRLLVRQTIDAATFSPERIIFEAAPILGAGLIRRPPASVLIEGGTLDTSECRDLSPAERAAYEKMVDEAKRAKQPEADAAWEAYKLRRGREIAGKQGIPLDKAVEILTRAREGQPLEGAFPLNFLKFGEVTVSDVLKDPAKYDQQALLDPLEPNYRSKFCAKFYANGGQDPCVHSFAHGGKVYPVVKPEVAAAPVKPTVCLPGGAQSISSAGRSLGELLKLTLKFFRRGGIIVRLEHAPDGQPALIEVKPAALASDLESVASLLHNDGTRSKPTTCSEAAAKLIGSSSAFRDALPPIHLLTRCPVLIERGGTLVQICGYDLESGIMAAGAPAAVMPLAEARELLGELVRDFRFPTEADRARALAAFIAPAMTMGGLLTGRAPCDLAEADGSQAGKGYRIRVKTALYGDLAKAVTQKKDGGVGSLEEAFNAAVARGVFFVVIDNLRAKLDSPAIESFITEESYTARSAYSPNIEIDPRRVSLSITSNKAELTDDMSNRCACVRILKQPEGYEFKTYPEGCLLEHVRANQPRYLGAVFAVIRAWHAAGRLRTGEARHDFRAWAQTMDWISRNLLEAGPLLDGHRETQQRMTNPLLNWLRDVALAVIRAERDKAWLRASDLLDLLVEAGVEVPGLPSDGDPSDQGNRTNALRAIGRNLGRCFRQGDTVTLDNLTVQRRETYDYDARHTCKDYLFTATINNAPTVARSPGIVADRPTGTPALGKLPSVRPACDYGARLCDYSATDAATNKTRVATNATENPLYGECWDQSISCMQDIGHSVGEYSRIVAEEGADHEGPETDDD